jgi:hypothetical protein
MRLAPHREVTPMADQPKKAFHVRLSGAEATADPVRAELPVLLKPVFYLVLPEGEPVRLATTVAYLAESEKRE